MTDPVVFASSRLPESDTAATILAQNGIPFYRRAESGGVEQAMPAAPVDFTGLTWLIRVPEGHAARAASLLSRLPTSRTAPRRWPGVILLVACGVVLLLSLVAQCPAVGASNASVIAIGRGRVPETQGLVGTAPKAPKAQPRNDLTIRSVKGRPLVPPSHSMAPESGMKDAGDYPDGAGLPGAVTAEKSGAGSTQLTAWVVPAKLLGR